MTSRNFGISRNGLEYGKCNVLRAEHDFSTKQKTFVNYDSKTTYSGVTIFSLGNP